MPGLWRGFSGLGGGASGLWNGLFGLGSTVPPVALGGFDTTFNSANLVYDEDDRLVYRTNAARRRAVRGRTGHTSGKWYAELTPLVARFRFVGVVDSSFNTLGAGGPAGTNRVGIEADQLVYFGGSSPIGFAAPGTVVRIAWDAGASRLWVKRGTGNWNNAPLANPATGVGGVSTAGLDGPSYIGATLRPVNNAGVDLRLPEEPGYLLPAGFSPW